MRIILTVAALACVAILSTSGLAGAGPNSKDSVKGNGLNNPPDGKIHRFHVNVQSGPNGEDVKGSVTFTSLETKRSFTGEATCLRVSGDQAVVVADFTKTRGFPDGLQANAVRVQVQDNGRKVAGQSPDEVRNSVQVLDAPTTNCPAPADPGTMPLTKGDVRVEDS